MWAEDLGKFLNFHGQLEPTGMAMALSSHLWSTLSLETQ